MAPRVARIVPLGLYGFMLGAPLTGWMMVSTASVAVPTRLFGLVPLPHLPLPRAWGETIGTSHEAFAWFGAALIVLHISGALWHQWMLGDTVLKRMAPRHSPKMAGMMAAVVGIAALTGYWLPDLRAGRASAAQAMPTTSAARLPLDGPDSASGHGAARVIGAQLPDPPSDPTAATADRRALPPAWDVQPGGTLAFTVDVDGSAMAGRFSQWSATIAMDPDDPSTARIAAEIAIASLTMDDSGLRDMAVGAGYLAAAVQPMARFESQDIIRTGANRYQARGTLSIRGVSRPQTLDFNLEGSAATRRVKGTADVRRTDFAIGPQDGGASISPVVTITLAFGARRRD